MMHESVTIKSHVEIFVEKVRDNAKHLKRHRPYAGFVIIGLAALLTGQCERTRFVQALEMANLDAWLVSQHTSLSRDVALIDIDDHDYRDENTFKGSSPLKQEEVKKLIALIAKAGASVIVVDIDTADWKKDDLPRIWLRREITSGQLPIVVWARTTHEVKGGPLLLNGYAGRDVTEPIRADDETVCWGVPKVMESGGFVRAYPRHISLGTTSVPSLAVATATVFDDPHPHDDETGSPNCSFLSRKFEGGVSTAILQTGSRRFTRYHAADLKAFMDGPQGDTGARPGKTPLSGKVVVLGGSFPEARDSYWTPVGNRDGIELLATAIDTERHTPMSLETSRVLFYVIDIVVGLLILLVGRLLPRTGSLLFVVGAIPVAAFLGSLLAFWSSYYASFMPVLVGVFLHKLFDDWWEAFKSREKGMVLRDQLDELIYSEETLSERKTLTTRITRGPA